MLVREEQGDEDAEDPTQHEDEPIATFTARLDNQLRDFGINNLRMGLFLLGFCIASFVRGRDLVLARAAAEHSDQPRGSRRGGPGRIAWKINIKNKAINFKKKKRNKERQGKKNTEVHKVRERADRHHMAK